LLALTQLHKGLQHFKDMVTKLGIGLKFLLGFLANIVPGLVVPGLTRLAIISIMSILLSEARSKARPIAPVRKGRPGPGVVSSDESFVTKPDSS
jgi:hypothetical protein